MPNNSTIVSGSSYINKDFNSIYGELLDLVKTLTNKWDPSLSNESDPGVVLIKLGALLSDKDNYNADKNVLELFPQSVSQYGNARKIYDIAGYSMDWYMSAITTLNFNYTGSDVVSPNFIRLNALSTMVSDDSGEIVYTLIEDAVLSTTQRTASVQCIQGVVQDYEVNGVSVITLENIDEYNRVYFDETMIAENGIFIANNVSGSTPNYIGDWERVDNLESRALNSKIFKFGVLPNSDTCYIEFPQDIANLIEGGLRIKYIITNGESGNISANTLTTFYSSNITATITNSDGSTEDINVTNDITIANPYAAVDGRNYEDLESAYNNYKDTVGTFNTLVTCKDYETAVNDVIDGRSYAASNCVVSDRTNDILDTSYIMQLTADGSREVLVNSDMDAFTIGMYALYPMNSIVNSYYYNKSFSVNQNMEYIKNNPENGIYSYKSIQHDYLDTTPPATSGARRYIYKNCYKLTGTVSTYYKVSATDATEIENNIRTALYSRFNARNIDFGTEIEYDDIVETIQGSDSRIKYVMLNQPEYVVKVMMSDDTIGSTENANYLTTLEKVELLSKMITAGNIQLFNFNHDFNYEFGQTNVNIYPSSDLEGEGISSITTATTIPSSSITGADGYVVKENENIILYTSSLVSQISYTAYVNISLQKASQGTEEINISANDYYVLGPNEVLYVNYVDTNNVTQNISYRNGTIIRPNFDLSSEASGYSIEKTVPAADGSSDITINFMMLSASQQIDIMAENATTFDNGLPCLWFTSDSKVTTAEDSSVQQVTYTLFDAPTGEEITAGKQERLLQNNEYFLYTNASRNELVILTSGTMLVREFSEDITYSAVECTNLLNVGDITSNGQSAVDENDWYVWRVSDGALSAHEKTIVTLGEGVTFKASTPLENVTNTAQVVINPQYITEDGNSTSLPIVSLGGPTTIDTNWYVVSRLNLSASSNTSQALLTGQSITYTYGDSQSATINGGTNTQILLNTPLTISGGENVDVTSSTLDGTSLSVLKIYSYSSSNITLPDGTNIVRNEDDYLRFPAAEGGSSLTLPYSFIDENSYYLIPFIKSGNVNTLQITATSSNIALFTGTTPESWNTTISITSSRAYYVIVRGAATPVTSLTLTWASNDNFDTSDSLLIGKIFRLSSINSYSDVVNATLAGINRLKQSSDSDVSATDLMASITELQTSSDIIFDYTYEVDDLDALDFTVVQETTEENDALAPKMLWDINHVCNKFTIGQMDTRNSSITVAATSRS